MAGTGLVTVKVIILDDPPPGEGLVTFIEYDPPDTSELARIVTDNCVLLMYDVSKNESFHWTAEPCVKFAPFTVSVVSPTPAWTEVGVMDVMTGTGLLTEKLIVLDDPPPGAGLMTFTPKRPDLVRRVAGTVAESWVPFTKVVVKLCPAKVTLAPEINF